MSPPAQGSVGTAASAQPPPVAVALSNWIPTTSLLSVKLRALWTPEQICQLPVMTAVALATLWMGCSVPAVGQATIGSAPGLIGESSMTRMGPSAAPVPRSRNLSWVGQAEYSNAVE